MTLMLSCLSPLYLSQTPYKVEFNKLWSTEKYLKSYSDIYRHICLHENTIWKRLNLGTFLLITLAGCTLFTPLWFTIVVIGAYSLYVL